jgi:hypothetical protein
VMEAFGVTVETQTVAHMTSEQRLKCLESIMHNQYGFAGFSVFFLIVMAKGFHSFLFVTFCVLLCFY